MTVNVMKGRKKSTYTCRHVETSPKEDYILITLCHVNDRLGRQKIIRLPRDGQSVYFMENGKNVDSVKWPRDRRKPTEIELEF